MQIVKIANAIKIWSLMMRRKLEIIFGSLAFLTFSLSVANAAEGEEKVDEESVKIQDLSEKNVRVKAATKLKNKAVDKLEQLQKENPFFPDWPVEEFDYFISPLLGFAVEKRSYPSYTLTSSVFEYGLTGALTGIPVVPSNPGLTTGLLLGKAWGKEDKLKINQGGSSLDGDGSKYQRTFGQVFFTTYYKAFRNRLGLKRGVFSFSTEGMDLVSSHSVGLENDAGILILPFLSGHYAISLDRAWTEKFNNPFLIDFDQWLFGKIAFSSLKTSLAFGPGYNTVKQVDAVEGAEDLTYKQSSGYLKAQFSSNPFWKILFSASAKYILSKDGSVTLDGIRLPDEDLYAPKEAGLPSDSLAANWFLGLDRLLGGMGVGYQVNLTITNYGDSEKKSVQRTSGFVVNYSIGL
jgi:hypothetical protein